MSHGVTLTNEAWEALFTAQAQLVREFLTSPAWDDVSMREYDVLYTLAKFGGPARLNDLREGVLLSQPALSRMVDRLVARGLVARHQDPTDRRAVSLSLTDEGRRLQREAGSEHARDVHERMSVLTEEELRTLRNLSAKLVRGAPAAPSSPTV